MTGSFYDPALVTLSYVVAVVASYTALELSRRISLTKGNASLVWLAAGSVSMGIGIWTMHFVGMLAYKMDMPFSYNVPITIVSLLIGIAASAFAIFVGSRANVTRATMVICGLILGAGIAGMHYSGMEAMEMPMAIVYDWSIVFASIVIAVVAATAAILISFTIAHSDGEGMFRYKVLSALIMGAGICGMHYTGMLAASYVPIEGVVMDHSSTSVFDSDYMAVTLGLSSLVILGVTHLTIFFDYRLSAERRTVEEAQTKAIQLSAILDDSPSEILIVDEKTLKFVSVNKEASLNLQRTREELAAMSPFDIKPDLSEEQFRAMLSKFNLSGKSHLEFESTHVRKDGTTYPVHVKLRRSTSTERPVYVQIITDTTERKLLENQLLQAGKMESIGQLAAGIAHEINTPAQFVGDNTRFLGDSFKDLLVLTSSLRDFVSTAKNGGVSDDDIESIENVIEEIDPDYLEQEIPTAVEQTLDGVDRISKIVLAMKEFSHPGGAEKESVNINSNIESTITVAANAWKYVATVDTEFDQSLPMVKCYPQQISQVILNLIVNSAHAITDKYGENPETLGKIKVATRQIGPDVEIRVSDNGCGIPDYIRNRIFEPFFTTKEVGTGSGQGLSMAYSTIVEKHKGKLSVESEEGVGTTFVIRLNAGSVQSEGEVAA